MTYEQKQSTRKCYNFHKEQINKNILTVIAVKKKILLNVWRKQFLDKLTFQLIDIIAV